MKKHNLVVFAGIFSLLILLPYLIANLSAGDQFYFNGFLLNPLDGNSYLAKMQEGWSGAWRFVLPYTANPGNGAYLFLFYIFLGHIARITHLPLIITFHAARILSAFVLLIVLYRFLAKFVGHEQGLLARPFILVMIGSGLGWLAFLGGAITSDFWVAEAYPFLSSYTNPHFPLGLAILLLIIMISANPASARNNGFIFLLGIGLSIILPFAIVILVAILAGLAAWDWLEKRKLIWQPLFFLLLGGGLFLIYQYWAILSDPILKMWNAQNNTPAPPLWDLVLAFSPVLILAFYGLWVAWRNHQLSGLKPLAIWFLIGIILIYFPFNLQRRFILGFYIPAAGLAVIGIKELAIRFPKIEKVIWNGIFVLSIPTNLIILLLAIYGMQTHDPGLYLTKSEFSGLEWISKTTPEGAVILSSPSMGTFIAANTGRRVIYGHPFETIDAEIQKVTVLSFFKQAQNTARSSQFLEKNAIDYIFYGPREQKLGELPAISGIQIAYNHDDVVIYIVDRKK
jgi:hypothetical protein